MGSEKYIVPQGQGKKNLITLFHAHQNIIAAWLFLKLYVLVVTGYMFVNFIEDSSDFQSN